MRLVYEIYNMYKIETLDERLKIDKLSLFLVNFYGCSIIFAILYFIQVNRG